LPELLEAVLRGNKTLDVTGFRRVYGGGPGRGFEIEEQYSQRGSWIRIDYPAGSPYAGQVIIDSPKERRHFMPSRGEIWTSQPRFDLRMERVAYLYRLGRLRLSAGERQTIATLPTRLLLVQLPDGAVVQRAYVHEPSGLVLKREMIGPGGKPMGGYEFTQVKFKAGLSRRDFQLPESKVVTPEDRRRELVSEHGFLDRTVTIPGYRLDSSDVFARDGTKTLVLSFAGLPGRVSLFQSRQPIDVRRLRRFSGPGSSSYAWKEGEVYFVLLGDADESVLRKAAQDR
jgi:hypothetical protein